MKAELRIAPQPFISDLLQSYVAPASKMNPLTNTRNITKLNEREIKLGVSDKGSWHNEYKDSAWIFVGGLNYELTEGDIISVFSQYGEIVNINLVRDKKTGKSKGYAFLCYEDQRSTILAVDNFNGIKLLGRIIRVDHVANYRIPKDSDDLDETTKNLRKVGCGPDAIDVLSKSEKTQNSSVTRNLEKHEKTTRETYESGKSGPAIKQEVVDPGYAKYETRLARSDSDKTSRSEMKRKSTASDHYRDHKHLKSEFKTKSETSKRSENDHHRSHRKSKHSSENHRSHRHSDNESSDHKHKTHTKHRK